MRVLFAGIAVLALVWLQGAQASAATVPPADRDGLAGAVVLNCGWLPGEGLTDCRVVTETPAGLGLGARAVAMARFLAPAARSRPLMINGRVKVTVDLPLPRQEPAHRASPGAADAT